MPPRRADSSRFWSVFFAALGLILASLGIYGVISYSVTRQTQEIGLRMALGATPERVQFDVIAMNPAPCTHRRSHRNPRFHRCSGAISSLLFATPAIDPITFAGMILSLMLVAIAAGYLPARRAARVNPMVALRSN